MPISNQNLKVIASINRVQDALDAFKWFLLDPKAFTEPNLDELDGYLETMVQAIQTWKFEKENITKSESE